VWWCAPVIPATQEDGDLGWPQAKGETLLKKKKKAKQAGGVAQVIVHLPVKHKALPPKKEEKKGILFIYCHGQATLILSGLISICYYVT
jgi:hypothetical protein